MGRRHPAGPSGCLVMGIKRKSDFWAGRSAFDPKWKCSQPLRTRLGLRTFFNLTFPWPAELWSRRDWARWSRLHGEPHAEGAKEPQRRDVFLLNGSRIDALYSSARSTPASPPPWSW
jgi:hypothetical protein